MTTINDGVLKNCHLNFAQKNSINLLKNWSKLLLICLILINLLTLIKCEDDEEEEYRGDIETQDDLLARKASTSKKLIYDPYFRDFTQRCMKLAQYSGF